MLTIDGATLEGGGQLTRLSLCLAAITATPIRIHSIRAGRSAYRRGTPENHKAKANRGRGDRGNDNRNQRHESSASGSSSAGGLKDSHLAALNFLAEHCRARVDGAQVGSTEVVFRPSPAEKVPLLKLNPTNIETDYTIALNKSGSVWLIFQAIFPFLVVNTDWTVPDPTNSSDTAGHNTKDHITLTLKGGTNASKAMTTEYVTQVFIPTIERIGLPKVEVETIKRGWAGNAPAVGEVRIKIHRPPRTSLTQAPPSPQPANKLAVHNPTKFILPSFRITDEGSLSSFSISIVADSTTTRTAIETDLTNLISSTFPNIPVDTTLSEPSHDPRRLYILLVAHTDNGHRFGVDHIGGGGKSKNASEAQRKLHDACVGLVTQIKRELDRHACVDSHMQDQLVGFQALSEGWSVVESELVGGRSNTVDVDEDGNAIEAGKAEGVGDEGGTLHTRTVRWVCETMLKERGVEFRPGGACWGIGWNVPGGSKSGEKDKEWGHMLLLNITEEPYHDWCGFEG